MEHIFWAYGIIAHLLLASIIVSKRIFKILPIFTLAIFFSFIETFPLLFVYHHLPHYYKAFYYNCDYLNTFLYACAILESLKIAPLISITMSWYLAPKMFQYWIVGKGFEHKLSTYGLQRPLNMLFLFIWIVYLYRYDARGYLTKRRRMSDHCEPEKPFDPVVPPPPHHHGDHDPVVPPPQEELDPVVPPPGHKGN